MPKPRRERRRHARSGADAARPAPARDGADARAASPADARGRPRVRRDATPYLLALVSAMLLTLAFPPVEAAWLAYVALVPLLVMAVRTRSPRSVFLAGWLGGAVFFGWNMHWIRPITWAGYLALVPYMGLYWAVFAWGLRRLEGVARVPLTLAAPVAWVGLEYVRGWLLTGLPWLFVGHTQHANLVLIQAADALGAYGTSFLVVATSALAADLLVHPLVVARGGRASARGPEGGAGPAGAAAGASAGEAAGPAGAPGGRRLSRVLAALVLAVAAAWVATVAYGLWRLGQTATRPGPVVTSIQTCTPQDVKNLTKTQRVETAEDLERELARYEQASRELLDRLLALTREALADAEDRGLPPDLVVWPETMVPGILGTPFLEYDAKALEGYPMMATIQRLSRGWWEEVREASRRAGAPLLFGGHWEEPRLQPDRSMLLVNRRNTAFLLAPGTAPYGAEHTYSKAHLVPFGEYVPLRRSWPWLNEALRSFTPYSYDYSLTPGEPDQAPFRLAYGARAAVGAGGAAGTPAGEGAPPAPAEARFQVAICYEDAMAYRLREMVRPAAADAARGKAVDFLVNISNDGWFEGSIELDQHLNLCVFRAVENRVPIVRSVNTGISAVIASDGRVGPVVEKGGERRMVTGHLTAHLALDDRVAPYTRVGDSFALACLGASAGLAAFAVARTLRRRKEAAP